MMSTTAAKPVTTPIPVQLSDSEFTAFIFLHFSMPKRGPQCKLAHSIGFSGKRIVSYGEGRSTLDLPLIREVQSQGQP
jgi:hypothetical protein